MKIERINDNQIRCTLSSFDLSVRNLNLGELAYGSEKARNLFREMIQKASAEVGFEAEDIPLMVEAIPLSNESVMLVITKIEDPEELDTRFAKFTPTMDEEADYSFNNLTNELLEGADNLLEYLQSNSVLKDDIAHINSGITESPEEKISSANQLRIYRFDSLDQISDAARAIGHVYAGENSVYKNPENGQFFLVVKKLPGNALDFSRICNTLSEYGFKTGHSYATEAYFTEHYELIIAANALDILSKI